MSTNVTCGQAVPMLPGGLRRRYRVRHSGRPYARALQGHDGNQDPPRPDAPRAGRRLHGRRLRARLGPARRLPVDHRSWRDQRRDRDGPGVLRFDPDAGRLEHQRDGRHRHGPRPAARDHLAGRRDRAAHRLQQDRAVGRRRAQPDGTRVCRVPQRPPAPGAYLAAARRARRARRLRPHAARARAAAGAGGPLGRGGGCHPRRRQAAGDHRRRRYGRMRRRGDRARRDARRRRLADHRRQGRGARRPPAVPRRQPLEQAGAGVPGDRRRRRRDRHRTRRDRLLGRPGTDQRQADPYRHRCVIDPARLPGGRRHGRRRGPGGRGDPGVPRRRRRPRLRPTAS